VSAALREFDDPEWPEIHGALIEATGAAVHFLGNGCPLLRGIPGQHPADCGLERVCAILKAARGADLIVTGLPHVPDKPGRLAIQGIRMAGEDLSITVLYLPQLLGLAMGLGSRELGLDLNLAHERGSEKLENYMSTNLTDAE
jgi:heterodisulfide reductase subunit B